MARKKAPAKKKGARKSSDDSGSNFGIVLVVLMIVVVGAAWYWKNGATVPDFLQVAGEEQAPAESIAPPEPEKPVARPLLRKERPAAEGSEIKTELASKSGTSAAAESERSMALREENEADDYNRYYYSSSFDFAWPAYSQDDMIVEHEGYTLAYNEEHEQASWVAYKVTATNLQKKSAKRKDNFRSDTYVRTKSADPDDYRNSGYDRGHLAAAADFSWSQTAMDGTFFMSNMSPQAPDFNRGVWKKLEEKVREWGAKNNELFVVTGPVVERGAKKIGKNKVAVPQKFYKIVLDLSEPEVKAIGFLLKNEGTSKDIMNFAVTIDSIEKMTNLDFFPMIPDDLENELESSVNKTLWK